MSDPSTPTVKLPDGLIIRHDLGPGDLGALVRLHGVLYAREYGYNPPFESYVAGPMAEFALRGGPRQRIWIVEHRGEVAGCIAVVEASDDTAQLRWFLLAPEIRGRGLGRRLLTEAVAFCREQGYRKAFLLTFAVHAEAATLYRSLGFQVAGEHTGEFWGEVRTEQRYELTL